MVIREIHTLDKNYKKYPSNLSKEEKKALQDLKSNKDLVLKPADKGGGVVVMNKLDYITEVKRQLADTLTYQQLRGDPTKRIQNQLSNLLSKFVEKGALSKNERDFMYIEEPVTPDKHW